MVSRIPKRIAKDLIYYVKSIKVHANFWELNAKSAWEFGRQMSSAQLKKINPNYQLEFYRLDDGDTSPAKMKVEFLNGKIWETETTKLRVEELRYELYTRAEEVEDEMDRSGSGPMKPGEDVGGKDGKDAKGAKGGKKK